MAGKRRPILTREERRAATHRDQVFRRIANYVLEGPSAIYPPKVLSQFGWLETFLTLEKRIPFKEPVEVRQVYALPNDWKRVQGYEPSEAIAPIVRQVVWRQMRDRARARTAVVPFPALASRTFSVPKASLEELRRLSLALDASFSTFPHEVVGISNDRLPELTEDTLAEGTPRPIVYDLTLSRGTRNTSLRLSCYSHVSAQFDEAFFGVWDLLGRFCTEENRIRRRWKESWFMPPKDYARLLNSTLR